MAHVDSSTDHHGLDSLVYKMKMFKRANYKHPDHSAYAPSSTFIKLYNIVSFLETIIGRDKYYKFLQSYLKLSAWILPRISEAYLSLSKQLTQIASGFSVGRRFIRIGHIPSAIKLLNDTIKNDTPEYGFQAFSCAMRACGLVFLFVDHAVWAAGIGAMKVNLERLGYWQAWLGLGNTGFNVLADISQYALMTDEKLALLERLQTAPAEEQTAANMQILSLDTKMTNLFLNIIRNSCDVPPTLNGIYQWKRVPEWVWLVMVFVGASVGVYQGLATTALVSPPRPPGPAKGPAPTAPPLPGGLVDTVPSTRDVKVTNDSSTRVPTASSSTSASTANTKP